MKIVTELFSTAPLGGPDRKIERDEEKFFEPPPANFMRFLNAGQPPLAVYNFPVRYEEAAYSPPRGVFEGPAMRFEWQMINGRQPFYHRNADVDEISFQIDGERTLITECGTVELRRGQFCKVPMGAAHDNYGREDVHLIFYIHGPSKSCVAPIQYGELRDPPFAGWQPASALEMISNGLGRVHSDVAYQMTDERLLINAASLSADRLELLEPSGAPGETEWIYKAPEVWIGHTFLQHMTERTYTRRICAEEIQYQIEGDRTLITQRGVVTLTPGDFICIPLGCAHASTAAGPSRHLTVLNTVSTPPVREPSRHAEGNAGEYLRGLA